MAASAKKARRPARAARLRVPVHPATTDHALRDVAAARSPEAAFTAFVKMLSSEEHAQLLAFAARGELPDGDEQQVCYLGGILAALVASATYKVGPRAAMKRVRLHLELQAATAFRGTTLVSLVEKALGST